MFLFLEKWTPGEMAHAALRQVADRLGLPQEAETSPPAEVSPPYFGGDRATNVGVRGDGSRMTVAAFLTRAEFLARTTHIAEVADMGPEATRNSWSDMPRFSADQAPIPLPGGHCHERRCDGAGKAVRRVRVLVCRVQGH